MDCHFQHLPDFQSFKAREPIKLHITKKLPTNFDNLGVILMDKTFPKLYGEKYQLLTREKS